jgi:ATP-dependent RNA helicase DDX23/PRP28
MAVDRIEQSVEFVHDEKKTNRLLSILSRGIVAPIIIFVNQKKNADVLGRLLEREGVT